MLLLGRFDFGAALFEALLEQLTQLLAGNPRQLATRASGNADHPHVLIAAAVTPGVALGFCKRTQASHSRKLIARSDVRSRRRRRFRATARAAAGTTRRRMPAQVQALPSRALRRLATLPPPAPAAASSARRRSLRAGSPGAR